MRLKGLKGFRNRVKKLQDNLPQIADDLVGRIAEQKHEEFVHKIVEGDTQTESSQVTKNLKKDLGLGTNPLVSTGRMVKAILLRQGQEGGYEIYVADLPAYTLRYVKAKKGYQVLPFEDLNMPELMEILETGMGARDARIRIPAEDRTITVKVKPPKEPYRIWEEFRKSIDQGKLEVPKNSLLARAVRAINNGKTFTTDARKVRLDKPAKASQSVKTIPKYSILKKKGG